MKKKKQKSHYKDLLDKLPKEFQGDGKLEGIVDCAKRARKYVWSNGTLIQTK